MIDKYLVIGLIAVFITLSGTRIFADLNLFDISAPDAENPLTIENRLANNTGELTVTQFREDVKYLVRGVPFRKKGYKTNDQKIIIPLGSEIPLSESHNHYDLLGYKVELAAIYNVYGYTTHFAYVTFLLPPQCENFDEEELGEKVLINYLTQQKWKQEKRDGPKADEQLECYDVTGYDFSYNTKRWLKHFKDGEPIVPLVSYHTSDPGRNTQNFVQRKDVRTAPLSWDAEDGRTGVKVMMRTFVVRLKNSGSITTTVN